MKIDKTVAASVALHALVIGWGLVSFSTRAFESMPEDSVPVDIISADQFAKAMAGMKTGKKENPKPLVEKVAEPKPPVDDAVGKIDDKKSPVVTDAAPPPTPKPEEKPVEKKPRSAKAGSRKQAEGGTEACGEEARSGQGRSDRRGTEEGGGQEASEAAAGQGDAASARQAESRAHL